jgi:type IV pilus assembly protein PilC
MATVGLGPLRLNIERAPKKAAPAKKGKGKRKARGTWLERNVPALYGVKKVELIVLTRQLATFIRAGIPILDGIRVVREQASSGFLRRTLTDIIELVEKGEPLSAALAAHPKVFSDLYVDLVLAAEATGDLDVILTQLAKYLERSESTKRKLRQAMLYPTLVLGMATVVIFILITFVLPAFVQLFSEFQAELPITTQVMLALGTWGSQYGLLSAGVFVTILFLIYLIRNIGPIRRLRDRITIRMPVIGPFVRLGIQTRFARTMAILLRAGVPIAQAFEIGISGTNNHVYRTKLRPVRQGLMAGAGIAGPLAASKLFSPLLVQMIKVGEETGTLDNYLEQAADFMDEDLDYKTKQMVTVIEPLMILGVAGIVGFVALSVVTPMYSILQQIHP